MKKYLRWMLMLPALTLVLAVCLSASPAPTPQNEPILSPVSDARVRLYTLGLYQGRLALYLPSRTVPETVYDTYAASLPEEEQIALQQGIAVYSQQQLQILLENYLS